MKTVMDLSGAREYLKLYGLYGYEEPENPFEPGFDNFETFEDMGLTEEQFWQKQREMKEKLGNEQAEEFAKSWRKMTNGQRLRELGDMKERLGDDEPLPEKFLRIKDRLELKERLKSMRRARAAMIPRTPAYLLSVSGRKIKRWAGAKSWS